MRWLTIAAILALILAWAAFLHWQYRGYQHERDLIEESLHQQSHSVMNALVGGIRSHRRLGFYFDEQIQGALEELAKSEDVVAVAVASKGGELTLSAGEVERLPDSTDHDASHRWNASGFCLVETFQVSPLAESGGRGRGQGGFGPGRGPWWRNEEDAPPSPFAAGGEFTAILLLDSSRADTLARRAAWSHVLVSASGTLLLVLLAVAWWASMRMVAARGRARVLETEARHLRELSQAAAGLAHETRNPLGLIRGWTQRLFQSDAEDPKRDEHARAVIEECDRVTARINQFLAFARPQAPEMEIVDLDELTKELATIVQPDLAAKNLELQRESVGSTCKVKADKELLRQALFNLVQNAIQFSPEHGEIAFRVVGTSHGRCRIEVSDGGPGVPEANVESLFTPYFTTRPEGTGLGLAIVRQIAAIHGWEAIYRTRPEGGSLFVLEGIHA